MTANMKNPGAGGRRGFEKVRSLLCWARLNATALGNAALLVLLLVAIAWQEVRA